MNSATHPVAEDQQTARWHVRSGVRERGRFLWETIVTNYFLGRLKAGDEVSLDQKQWYPLGTLVDCPKPIEQATAVSMDTAAPPAADGPRVAAHVAKRREQSARVWASLREHPQFSPQLAVIVVLGVLLVTLLVGLLIHSDQSVLVNCDQTIAAGARLDFCAKAGLSAPGRDLSGLSARNITLTGALMERVNLNQADLSYAELTGADLSLADLSHARLLGASLRRANLGHAQFRHADLRYADFRDARLVGANFTGARLDHALWRDGRVCAPQSVGDCR